MKRLAFVVLLLTGQLLAQTSFSGSFTITGVTDNSRYLQTFQGVGQVGTLGTAIVQFNTNRALSDDKTTGVGQAGNGYTLYFTRTDTINVSNAGIPDLTQANITVTGRINSGTGVYATIANPAASGATTTMTLTRVSTSPLRYTMSLSGAGLMNGQSVSLNMTNVTLNLANATSFEGEQDTGTGNIPPFGDVQASINSIVAGDTTSSNAFVQANGAWTIANSTADSIKFTLNFTGDIPAVGTPFTIVGGTGKYAGASGSGTVTSVALTLTSLTFGISGTLTSAEATTPIITSARTSAYQQERVAQNSWIEIKGTNLTPANTPAGGVFWSNAPEFAQGKMPTQLGDISVTVNGKPAYVWWFCSKVTTTACASDQINVLTPLDDATNQYVQVVVKNGNQTSAAYMVLKDAVNTSALLWDTAGHAVATHADYSYLGPSSLFPGLSTPAKRGDPVVLWLTGFGLPTGALVAGSATQSGTMPLAFTCSIEGLPATASVALVSPGLYQVNMTVPNNAPAGDNDHVLCNYGGYVMQGFLVAVQ